MLSRHLFRQFFDPDVELIPQEWGLDPISFNGKQLKGLHWFMLKGKKSNPAMHTDGNSAALYSRR